MKRCETCHYAGYRYACPICKRNERYALQGIELATCGRCEVVTRLSSIGSCFDCLKLQGLKECSVCKNVLPIGMEFHSKRGVCTTCERGLRKRSKQERTKDRSLRKKYGISLEAFRAILQAQGGVCAICRREPKEPVLDHSHATGKIRGILCHACNIGIGNLQDSKVVLASALQYLSTEEAPQLPEPVSLAMDYEELARKTRSAIEKAAALQEENEQLHRHLEQKLQEPGVHPDLYLALIESFRRYIERPGRGERALRGLDQLLLDFRGERAR